MVIQRGLDVNYLVFTGIQREFAINRLVYIGIKGRFNVNRLVYKEGFEFFTGCVVTYLNFKQS